MTLSIVHGYILAIITGLYLAYFGFFEKFAIITVLIALSLICWLFRGYKQLSQVNKMEYLIFLVVFSHLLIAILYIPSGRPIGDDAYYALATRILCDERLLRNDWAPYYPELPFTYPPGHFLLSGIFLSLTGLPLYFSLDSVILAYIALPLITYITIKVWSGDWKIALISSALFSVFCHYPSHGAPWLFGFLSALLFIYAVYKESLLLIVLSASATLLSQPLVIALVILPFLMAMILFDKRKVRKGIGGLFLSAFVGSPWIFNNLLPSLSMLGSQIWKETLVSAAINGVSPLDFLRNYLGLRIRARVVQLLAVVGLAVATYRRSLFDKQLISLTLIVFILATCGFWILPIPGARYSLFFALLTVILASLTLSRSISFFRRRQLWKVALLAVVIFLITFKLYVSIANLFAIGFPYARQIVPLMQTADWIKENTPPDALILNYNPAFLKLPTPLPWPANVGYIMMVRELLEARTRMPQNYTNEGILIPAIAARRVSMPHLPTGSNIELIGEGMSDTVAVFEAVRSDPTSPRIRMLLEKYLSRHSKVYVYATLYIEEFRFSPYFREVYNRGQEVSIFEYEALYVKASGEKV